ncbi:MAG: zf-HC2 domain-containing protein [Firmicutes bacterium]|nr:zf-HC2 domain-containing protein [Bacillota bacterium]
MMKTETLPCEIVRDLLPLYLEDLTGAETRERVDLHLQYCQECSEYLSFLRQGEPSFLEEDETEQIDYLKQVRRRSRRNYFGLLLSFFLVLLVGSLYFIASPSETNKMQEALIHAESISTEEMLDVANELTGPDAVSLSSEVRNKKINSFYKKADHYLAGQLNAVTKDTFRNMLSRENPDIPLDFVIARQMKLDKFSFAYYEGGRNCANLTTRHQVMELAVSYDWMDSDENGGIVGCYRVRFTCTHVRKHTRMVSDDGNWKVLYYDNEPMEIEPAEQYQIRLLGKETVSQIRQSVQKQFDTFEAARAEAEELQKLIFTDNGIQDLRK